MEQAYNESFKLLFLKKSIRRGICTPPWVQIVTELHDIVDALTPFSLVLIAYT